MTARPSAQYNDQQMSRLCIVAVLAWLAGCVRFASQPGQRDAAASDRASLEATHGVEQATDVPRADAPGMIDLKALDAFKLPDLPKPDLKKVADVFKALDLPPKLDTLYTCSGTCTCKAGQTCVFSGSGSALRCEAGSTCATSCGGGLCTQTCEGNASCTFGCGGGSCIFVCPQGATCNAQCAGGSCLTVDSCGPGGASCQTCSTPGSCGTLACPANGSCAQTCSAGGCVLTCAAGATCKQTCSGGGCTLSCGTPGTCTQSCSGSIIKPCSCSGC